MTIEEIEEEFEKLEMGNPIVSKAMAHHQCNGLPLEQALKMAIVLLANQSEQFRAKAIEFALATVATQPQVKGE